MFAAGLGAGCDDPPPTASAASAAAAPARFGGLAGPCPTLTGDAARALNATGPGRPARPAASAVPGVLHVACAWPAEGSRPSVEAVVSIHPNGFPGGDGNGNARRLFDSLRTDTDSAGPATAVRDQATEWGPGFVVANASLDTVTQNTLVENAVVTVVVRGEERLGDDMDAERDELMRRLGPSAVALTGDVVDDLR